jgi:hypothetical protein
MGDRHGGQESISGCCWLDIFLPGIEEVVTDQGYHWRDAGAAAERGSADHIPEKKQPGQRHWKSKREQQQAVYANRQRLNLSVYQALESR